MGSWDSWDPWDPWNKPGTVSGQKGFVQTLELIREFFCSSSVAGDAVVRGLASVGSNCAHLLPLLLLSHVCVVGVGIVLIRWTLWILVCAGPGS